MQVKHFHVGDILSVTTGILLSPRGIEAVYDVLDYMTAVSHFTHQLPRACADVSPEILRQLPQLARVDVTGVTRENWRARLDAIIAEHGEMLPLAPTDTYVTRDPIQELAEMIGGKPTIVVGDA
jgi:hypothetical protein